MCKNGRKPGFGGAVLAEQQTHSHKRPAVLLPPEEAGKQRDYTARCAGLLAERFGEDHTLLALVRSYGCQQNVNDGERIKGVLMDIGYGLCDKPEDADLILFNTCAVREHAEQRVFGNVGALKGLKEKKHGLIIGLCGCMANQKHVVEKLRQSYPYVDLVFGVDGIDTLPQLIAQ